MMHEMMRLMTLPVTVMGVGAELPGLRELPGAGA